MPRTEAATVPEREGAGAEAGTPFHFGPPGRPCFGWFHAPLGAPDGARRSGVVLVSPIAVDQTRSHRSYRHLARRLARAGFAVLRFDLAGTGDSAGDEHDPDPVATWLGNVNQAIEELRRLGQVDRVILVGLRLGATLAMTAAAARDDVESLVLWNPCPTGARYVDEVSRAHKMLVMLEPGHRWDGPHDRDGKEALGFFLSSAMIASLGRLDLLAITRRPAERILLVGADNPAADRRLLAHLGALGVDVEHQHMPGHAFLLQSHAPLPDRILDVIVAMVRGSEPPAAVAPPRLAPPIATTARFVQPSQRDAGAPEEIREQPLHFGERNSLFGILSRPVDDRPRVDRPAVIITNTGLNSRCGPQRSSVKLARQLSALGFPVLRFDLSGLGDSDPEPGSVEHLVFPPSALRDLAAAMQALRGLTPADRFVLLGLCSGGDHAFQTALRDPRVVGAVIMNPRTFLVNQNQTVEAYQNARQYQDSLFRKEKWIKLLRGQVDIRRAAALVFPKVKEMVRHRIERWTRGVRRTLAQAPDPADIPGCLRAIARRGVQTLLIVSDRDPGISYVDGHFSAEMRALRAEPGFRREDLKGADHNFTSVWSQELVRGLVIDYLAERFQ